MRGLNWLFFRPGIFEPDQQKSPEWNRGGYLVEGVAHCGGCHTPKNMFGANKRGRAFSGGPVQGWFAPRLDSAERSGLKSWSVDDIVEYLQSGRNGRSHAGKLMAEVVVNSTSKMSDADVRAIAVYLKDLPVGVSERGLAAPPQAQMADGAKLYARDCIACHEADGSAAARQCQFAVRRSLQHTSHHPRRRADGDDTARAQCRFDAGLRRQIFRSGNRRRHQLHPQLLGQRRAVGDAGASGKSAADVNVIPGSLNFAQKERLESGTPAPANGCYGPTEEPIHGQPTQSER
jgi:mono/diheme cytochrome c family protein